MKIKIKKKYLIAISLVCVSIILVTYYLEVPRKFEETRGVMDTFATITIYGNFYEKDEIKNVIDEAFSEIERIEKTTSFYDPESEIYKLNRYGYLNKEEATPEVRYLLSQSIYYYELSRGSFDVTIHPLLELWKGGLWKEDPFIQRKRMNETLKKVGYENIIMNDDGILLLNGASVDLGGIAKGYAVDRALDILRQNKIKRALIDIGGDMGAIGGKWTIGLVDPKDPNECITRFKISNECVATSGNYERYFDPSKKVHHIIDPRTGYPADGCISATVIAKSCTDADALATSIFVMGAREGIELIDSIDGVEALMIDEDGTIYRSAGMREYEF
jgi:thiamine biosynthesis lipoprotein